MTGRLGLSSAVGKSVSRRLSRRCRLLPCWESPSPDGERSALTALGLRTDIGLGANFLVCASWTARTYLLIPSRPSQAFACGANCCTPGSSTWVDGGEGGGAKPCSFTVVVVSGVRAGVGSDGKSSAKTRVGGNCARSVSQGNIGFGLSCGAGLVSGTSNHMSFGGSGYDAGAWNSSLLSLNSYCSDGKSEASGFAPDGGGSLRRRC